MNESGMTASSVENAGNERIQTMSTDNQNLTHRKKSYSEFSKFIDKQ